MIGVPFEDNDLTCLGKITEIIAELVSERPSWLLELASRFRSTEELAAWIRSLPQRDDDGQPGDGPKVTACEPWQRLRIPADDPNCVERSSLYTAVAEMIDPWPVRRLATLDFDWGRHTFPIEEGEPIVLNPRVTHEDLVQAIPGRARRIAHVPFLGQIQHGAVPPVELLATMPADPMPTSSDRARTASIETTATAPPTPSVPSTPAAPVAVDVNDAIAYTAELGRIGAQSVRNGPSRALHARNAIQNLVKTGTPPPDRETIEAMGWFLASADQVAQGYGSRALTIARTTAYAMADLLDDVLASQQAAKNRNLSFEIGGTTYEVPSWLSGLGGLAGKIGLNLGAAYAAPKLAALGVTEQMVDLVEQELNAEGYTLGPIAKPRQSFTSALNALSKRVS